MRVVVDMSKLRRGFRGAESLGRSSRHEKRMANAPHSRARVEGTPRRSARFAMTETEDDATEVRARALDSPGAPVTLPRRARDEPGPKTRLRLHDQP